MSLDNLCIVLVHPKYSGNIGAAARAMWNVGVHNLRLVDPAAFCRQEADTMAVHARELLDTMRTYTSLHEAIADCHMVIGTTCRPGLYREDTQSPRSIAPQIVQTLSANQVAVVFGPEDTGLTNTDLRYCHRLVKIPTAPTFSSLNIAQAVLVCCYEIFLAAQEGLESQERLESQENQERESPQAQIQGLGEDIGQDIGLAPDRTAAADLADERFSDDAAKSPRILAVAERQEFMYDKLRQALLSVGFLHRDNPEHIMFALRRILGRAGLEDRDVRILLGLAHQITWYAQSGWQLQPGQSPRQQGPQEVLDYRKRN